MDGRVHNLQRIILSQQRPIVCVFLLALVGSLLCSGLTAEAKIQYEIINTGIKGGGCWLDDQHFVVEQRMQRPGSQDSELEGLYVLDPNQPKELRRIDLSPIEPSLQNQIRDVTCQEENVLFHVLNADRKGNRLYILKIGEHPVLLAEKTKGFVIPRAVSTKNRYLLGFTSALKERGIQSSATPEEARADCPFAYVHPQYRVVCLRHDRGNKQTWLANNTFLTQYLWDETIRMTKDGQYKWVPNPEPPLKRADGTDLKLGYLLRDLENQIVQEIPMKQYPYQVVDFQPGPSGMYLYGVCYKAGDHGERHLTVGGRICRFHLDGKANTWEEVVSVQRTPRVSFSLHNLNVNAEGDVVMTELGHGATVVWKYTARTKQIEKVTHAPVIKNLGGLQLSPSGGWISFVQWVSSNHQYQLFLVRDKGVRP